MRLANNELATETILVYKDFREFVKTRGKYEREAKKFDCSAGDSKM